MPKIVYVTLFKTDDGRLDSATVWYSNGNRRIWGGDKNLPYSVTKFISTANAREEEGKITGYFNE